MAQSKANSLVHGGTFWELRDKFSTIDQLTKGLLPHVLIVSDPEIRETFARLRNLVVNRGATRNRPGPLQSDRQQRVSELQG
jgi:hypothetical protein